VNLKSERRKLSSLELFWSLSLKDIWDVFSICVCMIIWLYADVQTLWFPCLYCKGLLQKVALKLRFGMALKLLINKRSFMKKLSITSTNTNLVSFFFSHFFLSFSFSFSLSLSLNMC
jgi:hypothetical protein